MKRLLKLTIAVGLVVALLIPAGMALAIDGIAVYVDIKPASWPNPLNVCRKGVLSVAILGTEDFDVMMVDLTSISLKLADGMEYDGDGVAPLRCAYEDVAAPYTDGIDGDGCHELGPDGYLDLVLKFKTQELVEMDLRERADGEFVGLQITGETLEGMPILGEDTIIVINKFLDD